MLQTTKFSPNQQGGEDYQIIQLLQDFQLALDMLDDFDHQRLAKASGATDTYHLTYDECRKVIDSMSFGSQSTLFGVEKDKSFGSSIGTIYQTAFGKDVYPTTLEKSAHLLYFLTKNHSFVDGNKRIAAAIFVYFMHKNNMLYNTDHTKRIADQTLVALTVMVAQSRPEEKDLMIDLIINLIK